MAEKTKTLLIGCGGSGITTLIRLNEFMANDARLREDMAENISYLILDTNSGDLETFRKNINLHMGNNTGKMPIIRTIHTTNGYYSPEEIVNNSFGLLKNDADINLMKNYWWYHKDEKGQRPFSGERVGGISGGAGQCCQVSYLAAWSKMDEIGQNIESLLEEICDKVHGSDADPLSHLKVYIVAGLAGGTGRGSWPLVAFKVRQCLWDRGITVPIDGIFFDATCFPNIPANQEENTCVNSCTGMSELAAWIRMKLSNNRKPFTLPSLYDPRNNPAVISFTNSSPNEKCHCVPIDSAYLVFGKNGKGARLADNEQYHKMAAAALYSMMVNAKDLDAKMVNERSSVGSFASTVFEVDSIHIQMYLATAVQKAFLEKQYAEADAAMIQEVKEFIGTTAPLKEGSFLERTHLWIPQPAFSSISSSMKNSEGCLLQKLMTAFQKNVEKLKIKVPDDEDKKKNIPAEISLTKDLREKLASQNLEDVQNAVKKMLDLKILADNTINQYFKEILDAGKLGGEDLGETLRELVLEQFAPEDSTSISLRRAMVFTEELKNVFSKYCSILDGGINLDNKQCADLNTLKTSFNELVSECAKTSSLWREKISLSLGGIIFNPDEVSSLCKKFQYYVDAAVFFRVRGTLKAFFVTAVDELDKILETLKRLAGLLEKSNRKLDDDLKPVFGSGKNDGNENEHFDFNSIFDVLFSDPDKSDAVEEAIPPPDDKEGIYHRKMKPILSTAELNKMLVDPDNFYADSKKIKAAIKNELNNLLDLGNKAENRTYPTIDDAEDEIPKNISREIRKHVRLKSDFTDRHFSFDAVLGE